MNLFQFILFSLPDIDIQKQTFAATHMDEMRILDS